MFRKVSEDFVIDSAKIRDISCRLDYCSISFNENTLRTNVTKEVGQKLITLVA